MGKIKTKYVCSECGYNSLKWMGKCPECDSWHTLLEEYEIKDDKKNLSSNNKPISITEIKPQNELRSSTGIKELDIVLGGGLVDGSLILVGGDPGIGKSTLLLQASSNISQQKKVLYVTGEESLNQTKLRAERLSISSEKLMLFAENNIHIIIESIKTTKPEMVVIDSIQTMYDHNISSAPGSVSQVREATSRLMEVAKGLSIPTFIVGHVTKNGAIAGPKVLEHIVDTVLYFEGEKHNVFRILRAVKNRFGSTNEIGVFEMSSSGLEEVKNPSDVFILNRPEDKPGSSVLCTLEGTRPILIEVQALTSVTNFGTPRRLSIGLDYNRLTILIAILEKIIGFALHDTDIYLNVVGGIKLDEPGVDLAVMGAIVSSYKNIVLASDVIMFGEVGLTGEVRAITNVEKRINEAKKMGFKKIILPKKNTNNLDPIKDIELIGITSIREMIDLLF